MTDKSTSLPLPIWRIRDGSDVQSTELNAETAELDLTVTGDTVGIKILVRQEASFVPCAEESLFQPLAASSLEQRASSMKEWGDYISTPRLVLGLLTWLRETVSSTPPHKWQGLFFFKLILISYTTGGG